MLRDAPYHTSNVLRLVSRQVDTFIVNDNHQQIANVAGAYFNSARDDSNYCVGAGCLKTLMSCSNRSGCLKLALEHRHTVY